VRTRSRQFADIDHQFSLGFLNNPRRANSALSRAIQLLVIVGDKELLVNDPYVTLAVAVRIRSSKLTLSTGSGASWCSGLRRTERSRKPWSHLRVSQRPRELRGHGRPRARPPLRPRARLPLRPRPRLPA